MPRTLCNDVLGAGCVPHAWHTTWFLVLAKSQKAKNKLLSDQLPAFICYTKFCLYDFVARGNVLDTMRPKEQHRFRHYCEHCH